MAKVRHLAFVAGLVLALAGAAFGQTMLQHAVTAAGGSAAGVAGKPLSDGIDSIFGNLSKQMEQSAGTGQLEANRKTPVELTQEPGAAAPSSQTASATPVIRRNAPAARGADSTLPAAPGSSRWEGEVFAAMQPEPTREDLGEIEEGFERAALIGRLGPPSVRIIIPEWGELREVYYFSGDGEHLGTVELADGQVQVVNIR